MGVVIQLTLDGREVERPRRPRPLSHRQRELLRYIRQHGVVRPVEIGLLMHAGRPSPSSVLDRRYASSDGWDALRRLERRGLVERQARGQWVALISGEGWS